MTDQLKSNLGLDITFQVTPQQKNLQKMVGQLIKSDLTAEGIKIKIKQYLWVKTYLNEFKIRVNTIPTNYDKKELYTFWFL